MIEYICCNEKCRMTQLENEIGADGRCSYCACDSLFEREVDDETFEPLLEIAVRNLKRLAELN